MQTERGKRQNWFRLGLVLLALVFVVICGFVWRASPVGLDQKTAPATVGVVLPVFNGAEFIAAAIQSVICQDFADWKLVVVDDGSTDSTAAVVRSFTDPRVSLVSHHQNRGLALALNTGLACLDGLPHLTWISADNTLYPSFLSRLRSKMLDHPEAGVITGSFERIDSSGRVFAVAEGKLGDLRSAIFNFTGCAAFMWSSAALARFSTITVASEDYAFWLDLLRRFPITLHVSEVLLRYRHHKSSLTSKIGLFWRWDQSRLWSSIALQPDLVVSLYPVTRFCTNRRGALLSAHLAFLKLIRAQAKQSAPWYIFAQKTYICGIVSKINELSSDMAALQPEAEKCPIIQGAAAPSKVDIGEYREKERVWLQAQALDLSNQVLTLVVVDAPAEECKHHGRYFNALGFFDRIVFYSPSGKVAISSPCQGLNAVHVSGDLDLLHPFNPSVVQVWGRECDAAGTETLQVPIICVSEARVRITEKSRRTTSLYWAQSPAAAERLVSEFGVSRRNVWLFSRRVNCTLFRQSLPAASALLAGIKPLIRPQSAKILYLGRQNSPALAGLRAVVQRLLPTWEIIVLCPGYRETNVLSARHFTVKALTSRNLYFYGIYARVICLLKPFKGAPQRLLEVQAFSSVPILAHAELDNSRHFLTTYLAGSDLLDLAKILPATLKIAPRYDRSPASFCHEEVDRREIELFRIAAAWSAEK